MKVKSSSIPELSAEFFSSLHELSRENNNRNILAGFAVQAESGLSASDPDALLKSFERSFFLSNSAAGITIIGLDEVLCISESGDVRFALTDKKVRELKPRYVNNFSEFSDVSFPVFLGGMKFTPDHPGNEWDEFSDSTWFVPELCLFKQKEKSYVIVHSLVSSSTDMAKIKTKVAAKLELLQNSGDRKNAGQASVRSVSGNSIKDKKKWKTKVAETVDEIMNNQIDKVVLSRRIEMSLDKEVSFAGVISHFEKNYPDCYSFIFHRGKSAFFGASPELLAKFRDQKVYIEALAGSAPRGSNDQDDAEIAKRLLNDPKNLNEHKFVIESIMAAISAHSENPLVEMSGSIKKLMNIQHIASVISADLKDKRQLFTILKELYPTPAVCGTPREAALSFIKKNEGYKRGLYSGIIGWFNFDDEGDFVVAIRSALSHNTKVFAFAGCGIVDNSDPEHEYNESELKLIPVTSIFTDDKKN